MVALVNFFDAIRGFIELGGNVLWGILVVLLMMGLLIIGRYVDSFRVLPGQRREIVEQWATRRDRQSWHAGRIREELISRLTQQMQRNVKTINTLIAVCPLLGLIGTVTGMVAVFDVMAFFGTGNARAMAAGVSQATLPTIACMVEDITYMYLGFRLARTLMTAYV